MSLQNLQIPLVLKLENSQFRMTSLCCSAPLSGAVHLTLVHLMVHPSLFCMWLSMSINVIVGPVLRNILIPPNWCAQAPDCVWSDPRSCLSYPSYSCKIKKKQSFTRFKQGKPWQLPNSSERHEILLYNPDQWFRGIPSFLCLIKTLLAFTVLTIDSRLWLTACECHQFDVSVLCRVRSVRCTARQGQAGLYRVYTVPVCLRDKAAGSSL